MNYICRNIDNASKVKILPSVMFSEPLAKYIDELADLHSVHQDSLAIVLINCVAATLEFSHVLRSNCFSKQIPTNLYNVIVARSSYGKSDLTKMLRDMLKMVADHRPTKFYSTTQSAVGDQVNPTLDEMSKAGLMSGLDGCCRTLVCDEADMTFADVGLFLTNNSCRSSVEMNCRGLVTSLFDRVCHPYIRQLANRTVSVERSKLNILGCSTGDIISSMVIRMKSGASFDPAIGRFLFWALDGPVIPDTLTRRNIDNYVFASLNQFVLILSFIENVIFSFDDDAVEKMISWGNSYKLQSYDERNNDECLSARLGKAVPHAYRLAAFLQTVEIGFEICDEFIQSHQCFPANGGVDTGFVDKVSALFHLKYPDQFRQKEPNPFQISKDVALRAIDIISGNMHQFMLLFDSRNAPKVSSIGRQVIVVSPDQRPLPFDSQDSATSEKKSKQQQRHDFNFNKIAVEIILYPSVCFTLKQLHGSSVLHNSGGIPLKNVAKTLVDSDILTVCPRGIKNASKSTPVFIKQLPLEDDNEDESDLISVLSEYTKEGQPISLASYKSSCNSFSLLTTGIVQDDVYEILARPEYRTRNFFALLFPPNTAPVQTPPSTNDDYSVADSTQHTHPVQNDSEEAHVVDMLSTYMHGSDASSPIILMKGKEKLFQDINLDDVELNNTFDDINITDEQETNDSNVLLIANQQEDNDSNVATTAHEQEDNESNVSIISNQQQNNNTNDISISGENKLDNSSDTFSNPLSWRTRSKSKTEKQIAQSKSLYLSKSCNNHTPVCIIPGFSNTGAQSIKINHRKRKSKEPKRLVKKPAVSKRN